MSHCRALNRTKLKASGTFLHHDSARSRLSSDKDDKFETKRLPHPPDSPGLASCDFWLFGYLEHFPEGQFFDDYIALEGPAWEILIDLGAHLV
jgi:hypothetical protein